MPDVQEVFRMSAQKVRQEPGALERQHARQRQRSRSRRMGAFALVAALGIAAAVFAVRVGGSDDRPQPATEPTPSPELEVSTRGKDYLLDLETGERTPLPESIRSDGRNGYAVSPDGSEVAYYGRTEDSGKGVFVAISTGPVSSSSHALDGPLTPYPNRRGSPRMARGSRSSAAPTATATSSSSI